MSPRSALPTVRLIYMNRQWRAQSAAYMVPSPPDGESKTIENSAEEKKDGIHKRSPLRQSALTDLTARR